MKFGCCIPGGSFMPQGVGEVDKSPFGALKNGCLAVFGTGFSFAEITVGLAMSMAADEIDRARRENITIEAANSFIPGSLPIIKGGEELEKYAAEAIRRISLLGGKVIVFGSGGARRTPDGISRGENYAAIKRFLAMCDGYCKKYGVKIAVEPLNSNETNIINSVAEGAALVRDLNVDGYENIGLLADSYHMCQQSEDGKKIDLNAGVLNESCLSEIIDAADLIIHTHIAEPKGRAYPGSDDGKYLVLFADALKKAGYGGNVSIECGFKDFLSEAAPGLDFMKRTF